MPGDIDIGDNYEFDEDSNGDLVIKDATDTVVLKHTDGGGWDISDITTLTGESTTGVYDDSTQTVGDGTTSADHQSVNTETIGSERHYAGGFDGADADARLDAALSEASEGDTVYLENATYSGARTISKSLKLVGSNKENGTTVEEWTLSGRSVLSNVTSLSGTGTLTLAGRKSALKDCSLGGTKAVSVEENQVLILGCTDGNITFIAGTSGGLVDSCSGTSVTDNGSNTVGNVA